MSRVYDILLALEKGEISIEDAEKEIYEYIDLLRELEERREQDLTLEMVEYLIINLPKDCGCSTCDGLSRGVLHKQVKGWLTAQEVKLKKGR